MAERLIALNHPELQLLDLVEESCAWVAGVVTGASWESSNKWRSHPYSPEVWADALDRLLVLGLVVIREEGSRKPLQPTRGQLMKELTRTDVTFDALDPRKPLWPVLTYWLTPSGAEAWEQFARPDWDRYIDESYPSEDSSGRPRKTGLVTSARRECVEDFLRQAHHLGFVVDHDTVHWTEIRPFEVRYWKSLPVGHQAEFAILAKASPDWGPREAMRLLSRWRHLHL